ncbi:MAG TPA: FAD-dependent oxidoreductase [Candidatus Polarisedimenticolia bacterium]|jgi:glycine/D-amino acid oxidase-like deaminating enzyme|nr:FAD-dependent oxidoreductase [Candidatus Polarisedimenticolia bacterium]
MQARDQDTEPEQDRHQDQSQSVWMDETTMPEGTPLTANRRVEICVIGGGIAGLTTAYLLGREGRKVLLLDDGRLAGGQTQRTTAHLSNVIDDGYASIERLHGKDGARLAAESHTAAILKIEAIVREERLDADFERLEGYLFLRAGGEPRCLQHELEAARRAGLDVEPVTRAPLPAYDTGPALRFRGQAQFHPLKYLAGLARAILRDGGEIHTGTKVSSVTGGPLVRVRTEAGPVVVADAAVVATNTPFNDRVEIQTKQAGYMTYAIAATVPAGSVAKALYWDTEDPYHYVRLQRLPQSGSDLDEAQRELLIVGGEDHKTGQADHTRPRYDRLEAWARERFPMIREVMYRWSGQVRETIDGLGFIGKNPLDQGVYIATGDSGMGMTHGTIAGILLTDLLQKRKNRWSSLYAPARRKVGAVGGFLQENLNVARQYFDYLRRKPSQELSLVCPHLGCLVNWNDAENTWDCPCHGSRFDRRGRVICGPANQDLEPARERALRAEPPRANARGGREDR